MKRQSRMYTSNVKVARFSATLSLGTVAAAVGLGALPSAAAATTAACTTAPSWHVVGAIPGAPSGKVSAVVPTGQTTGYAFANGTGKIPAAYERTGATTWKKIPFPGNSHETVVAAQASNPQNVWAFVNNSANGLSAALKLVNGKWVSDKTFPAWVGGVSVLSSTEVWVYGLAGTSSHKPLGVWEFDGSAWHKVAATLQGGGEVGIDDIWAYSGSIVGHYEAGRWTGTDLAPLLKGQGASGRPRVYHVLSLSAGNVYAIGAANGTAPAEPVVLLHYNGATWSKVAVSSEKGYPTTLAPDGQGGLWIPIIGPGYAEMLHYSGGRLTRVTLPGGAGGNRTAIDAVAGMPIPVTPFELAGGEEPAASGAGTTAVILQYS